MRQRTVVGGVIGVLAGVSAVLALTGVAVGAPASTPISDVVGAGLVNCASVTGEVGYSPATITGGTAAETVSIWFQAKKCTPAAGTTATPVPKSVIGSMSFSSVPNLNGCPQLGNLGTGTLNLTYNYPPVPVAMIDPSVAPSVAVTQVGAFWDLAGAVTQGSYPSPTFSAVLKPDVIAPQTCANGITSEYIIRGTLTNI